MTAANALRHMTWNDALQMVRAGHWLGAHTRTHPILGALDAEQRRDEIAGSVAAIRDRLHTRDVPFAYPNGQPGDFGEADVALLRELEVSLACTGIAGANRPACDLLQLRRNGVGLHHRRAAFTAELLGFRDGRHAREHQAKANARRGTSAVDTASATGIDETTTAPLDLASRYRAVAGIARLAAPQELQTSAWARRTQSAFKNRIESQSRDREGAGGLDSESPLPRHNGSETSRRGSERNSRSTSKEPLHS